MRPRRDPTNWGQQHGLRWRLTRNSSLIRPIRGAEPRRGASTCTVERTLVARRAECDRQYPPRDRRQQSRDVRTGLRGVLPVRTGSGGSFYSADNVGCITVPGLNGLGPEVDYNRTVVIRAATRHQTVCIGLARSNREFAPACRRQESLCGQQPDNSTNGQFREGGRSRRPVRIDALRLRDDTVGVAVSLGPPSDSLYRYFRGSSSVVSCLTVLPPPQQVYAVFSPK